MDDLTADQAAVLAYQSELLDVTRMALSELFSSDEPQLADSARKVLTKAHRPHQIMAAWSNHNLA